MAYSVNGVNKTMGVAPEIVNDRTIVPARFIIESLGDTVSWSSEAKKATFEIDGKTVSVTIGVIGEGMDTAPYILGDRAMVPLRFITEMLRLTVNFDEETRDISIFKEY